MPDRVTDTAIISESLYHSSAEEKLGNTGPNSSVSIHAAAEAEPDPIL
jgi:hypothetical protein